MIGRLLLFCALAVAVAIVVAGACAPQPPPVPQSTPTPSRAASTVAPTVARPSPTPTPTATTSPTPAATGTTGTPLPACAAQTGGSPNAGAQLTGVRAAHQPSFDRVVFEFGASTVAPYGLPSYELSVVTQFVAISGRPVPVDGNAFLQVRFRNASTVDPNTGQQTFTQSDLRPGLPLVREVKLIDDFERVMTWGIGLDHLVCAKVTELSGPARLVVDLPTPP